MQVSDVHYSRPSGMHGYVQGKHTLNKWMEKKSKNVHKSFKGIVQLSQEIYILIFILIFLFYFCFFETRSLYGALAVPELSM